MRPSLNQFERVEAYVLDTLPLQERLAFEAELTENPDLQSLVEFQQQVIRTVNRQALRTDIDAVSRQFGQGGGGTGHFPWKWIFSSFVVAVAGIGTWLALSQTSVDKPKTEQVSPAETDAPVTKVSEQKMGPRYATLSLSQSKELFPLFPMPALQSDPVFEIPGIVENRSERYLEVVDFNELDFLPPGFMNRVEEGMPFKTHKNADRQLCDSIYYTLGSFSRSAKTYSSDDNTAGKMGVLLEKSKGILAGDRVIKGSIVTKDNLATPWGANVTILMNGKSSRKLIRVNRWGYFRFNRAEVGEAIIYFQSNWYKSDTQHVTIRANGPKVTRLKPFVLERMEKPSPKARYEVESNTRGCYIDPLSIKVIRSSAFEQTYLATYAFEQRLAKLHTQPNGQELFEIYVANLGKDLYRVDSLVATRVRAADQADFIAFSKERLTNVRDSPNEKKLFATYVSKLKDAADQQRQLEKSYCRRVSKQIEQLEDKIQTLSVKTGRVSVAASAANSSEIYTPKTSTMTKSETTLVKLETRLDELVEGYEAEDALLEGLIEFLDPCCKSR